MDIIKSLEWRYACKKFDKNKKLSDEQLNTIKNAFSLTATSFGLQPLKMVIIKSDAIKERLLAHAYYQQQITTCSHILILCIDTEVNGESIDAYFDLEKETRGTSEDIVGKFRNQLKDMFANKSAADIERSAIYQTYITIGNLMTVCAIGKIDSCPMEGFISDKFDEVLNLKSMNLRSVLLLPVGFRAEDDFMSNMKKVRKPISDTVIEIDQL
jgi:nitroreductase